MKKHADNVADNVVTNNAGKKKGVLSWKEIILYSVGLAGVQLVISYMNSYQAQFYNATMGADFTIIAFVLLAAKLISAFVDPFIGKLIDNSNLKGGKLKPFVLIGCLAFSLTTVVIFISVPFTGVGMYAYIFVTFLMWSIAMTFVDVPTQGMLSIMSPDIDDRNKTAGVANLIKGVGFVGCFVIVPAVCLICKTGSNPMAQKEYLISTLFIVIVGAILIMMIYFFAKERVPYTSETVSTKEMLKMVKENKPLMLVVLSSLLGFGRGMSANIQVQAAAVLIGTVSIGNFVINGENAGLVMGVGCAVATAISGAIVPVINKKFGEKKTFIGFAIYGFIVTLIAFLMYLFGITSIWMIIVSLFFIGFMYGPHGFMPLVMVPDCVDYYELKTGKRTDGVHFAVLSLTNKIAAALGVAFGLLMVGISKYTVGNEITTYTKNVVWGAYVLVPGISCILSMIPIFWYKLTGKEKQRIADELAARRAAKAAEESAVPETTE